MRAIQKIPIEKVKKYKISSKEVYRKLAMDLVANMDELTFKRTFQAQRYIRKDTQGDFIQYEIALLGIRIDQYTTKINVEYRQEKNWFKRLVIRLLKL